MLDRVANFKPEDWDTKYKEYTSPETLATFRSEIKTKDQIDAINSIAKLDGFVNLPIIKMILGDIRVGTEKKIKEICNIPVKVNMREHIAKVVGNDIREIFEAMIKDTSMKELTYEKVKKTIDPIVGKFFSYVKNKKNDMTNETAKILISLIYNEIFCIGATEMYDELNQRQVAAVESPNWTLIKLMAPYKLNSSPTEAIQKPFIGVCEIAKMITVMDDDSQLLWKELTIWLEGMYQRSFSQIPQEYRDGDHVKAGQKPLINKKDEDLNKHFGLTLYDIAMYHRETANSILTHLTPIVEKKPVVEVKQIDSPKPEEITEKKDSPPQQIDLLEIPAEKLEQISRKEADVKFTMLISSLRAYKLNDMQKENINNFSKVIATNLEQYKNAPFRTSGFPNTRFFPRPHIESVDKSLTKLALADSALKTIEILFKLRQKVDAQGSIKLKEALDHLVEKIVDILSMETTYKPGLRHGS